VAFEKKGLKMARISSVKISPDILREQLEAYSGKKRIPLRTKERFSKWYYAFAFDKLKRRPVGTRLNVFGYPKKSVYLKVRAGKIHTVEDGVLVGKG
jgi:hypothetical protein